MTDCLRIPVALCRLSFIQKYAGGELNPRPAASETAALSD